MGHSVKQACGKCCGCQPPGHEQLSDCSCQLVVSESVASSAKCQQEADERLGMGRVEAAAAAVKHDDSSPLLHLPLLAASQLLLIRATLITSINLSLHCHCYFFVTLSLHSTRCC